MFGKSLDTIFQLSGILLLYLTDKRPLVALKTPLFVHFKYRTLKTRVDTFLPNPLTMVKLLVVSFLFNYYLGECLSLILRILVESTHEDN